MSTGPSCHQCLLVNNIANAHWAPHRHCLFLLLAIVPDFHLGRIESMLVNQGVMNDHCIAHVSACPCFTIDTLISILVPGVALVFAFNFLN